MAKNYTTSASGSGNWNSSYVRREDARIIYLKRAIEILAQINEFFEETNMKIIRVTYYELIDISTTTAGSLQDTPVGATINDVALGSETGALLSTLTSTNTPTFESPLTPEGAFIGVDLDVNGNYLASDTYPETVALIYTFVITFKDFKDYVSELFTIDHTATDLPTKIVAHPDEPDQFSPGQNTNNLEEIVDIIGGYREATHTGRLKGGEVTQENLTEVRIQAGLGVIVDSFTDPENPTNTFVTWDEQVVSLDPPTDEFTGVIAFNSLGQIVRVFGAVTAPQLKTLVPIVRITINPFTGDILEFNSLGSLSNNFLETIFDWMNVRGFNQIIDGLLVDQSVNGTSMQLQATEGNVFSLGINIDVDRGNPNRKLFPDFDPADLLYIDNGPNVYNTLNLVDPNNYDPDFTGTRTAVPGGNFTNQLVYITIGQRLFVQYGPKLYATADAALQDLPLTDLTWQTPEEVGGIVIRRLWITIQQGETDLGNAVLTPIVGQTPAGGGGESEIQNKIVDSDQDTRVEVEFTADDDRIRFFNQNVENGVFEADGTFRAKGVENYFGSSGRVQIKGGTNSIALFDQNGASIGQRGSSSQEFGVYSVGNVRVDIDSNNNRTDRRFLVTHNNNANIRFSVTEQNGVVINPRTTADTALNASALRFYDPNNNASANGFQGNIDWFGNDGNRAMYIGQASSGNLDMIVLNDVGNTATNLILQQDGAGSIYLAGQLRGKRGNHAPGFGINTSDTTVVRWSTAAILRRDTPRVASTGGYIKFSYNDTGGNVTVQAGHGSSGASRQFTRSATVASGSSFGYWYSERLGGEWFPNY